MKALLVILGTMYLLGALNAIRKRRKIAAVHQLFWALAVAGVLLFSGCGYTTSPAGGVKPRILTRINPLNWGESVEPASSWLQIMADDMAGFQYTAIVCIIVGFVISRLRIFPRTGLGYGLMILGGGLSLWGLLAPKFVGIIAVVGTVALVVGLVYVAYCLITGRKIYKSSDPSPDPLEK